MAPEVVPTVSPGAVERAMRLQEVILRALSGADQLAASRRQVASAQPAPLARPV